jgi:hypothetical protein
MNRNTVLVAVSATYHRVLASRIEKDGLLQIYRDTRLFIEPSSEDPPTPPGVQGPLLDAVPRTRLV